MDHKETVHQMELAVGDDGSPEFDIGGIALQREADSHASHLSNQGSDKHGAYPPGPPSNAASHASHHSIHIHDDRVAMSAHQELTQHMSSHSEKLGVLNSNLEAQANMTRMLQLFILLLVFLNAITSLVTSLRSV